MDLMTRRRALLARVESEPGIDTSPRIAEYGTCWGPAVDRITANANWCRTEWYDIIPNQENEITIHGYVGSDSRYQSFQFKGARISDGTIYSNWNYFGGASSKRNLLSGTMINTFSFSIETSIINNAYAYVEASGQILFAGRNTPYYGYTNIHDMPTGT